MRVRYAALHGDGDGDALRRADEAGQRDRGSEEVRFVSSAAVARGRRKAGWRESSGMLDILGISQMILADW